MPRDARKHEGDTAGMRWVKSRATHRLEPRHGLLDLKLFRYHARRIHPAAHREIILMRLQKRARLP
jgi:hypothetical protein